MWVMRADGGPRPDSRCFTSPMFNVPFCCACVCWVSCVCFVSFVVMKATMSSLVYLNSMWCFSSIVCVVSPLCCQIYCLCWFVLLWIMAVMLLGLRDRVLVFVPQVVIMSIMDSVIHQYKMLS
jgi:hypothetical protein